MEKAKTTIRNEKLFCLNCGGEHKIKYPLPIEDMTSKIEAFNILHADCEKTWEEPKADQSQDTMKKAMWWIANGHVGMSSKTMWLCLTGQVVGRANHPYDPDDFSRCYKLLQAVPEWKSELHKLKELSSEWCKLVDNWDKLTEMYEQNIKEEWKNRDKIGMYQFMQKLLYP